MTTPASVTRDYRYKTIGGVKVQLALGELRVEYFGLAPHVAVRYDIITYREQSGATGGNCYWSWLPQHIWDAIPFDNDGGTQS